LLFWLMAQISSAFSFPAPGSSRSITYFGIGLLLSGVPTAG
jgi:hypothetical protein